ncbi:MAG: hypothetical protein KGZ39_02775, partial [Simkania sp.]|nr:hypothetical protein [Simkania sp.]
MSKIAIKDALNLQGTTLGQASGELSTPLHGHTYTHHKKGFGNSYTAEKAAHKASCSSKIITHPLTSRKMTLSAQRKHEYQEKHRKEKIAKVISQQLPPHKKAIVKRTRTFNPTARITNPASAISLSTNTSNIQQNLALTTKISTAQLNVPVNKNPQSIPPPARTVQSKPSKAATISPPIPTSNGVVRAAVMPNPLHLSTITPASPTSQLPVSGNPTRSTISELPPTAASAHSTQSPLLGINSPPPSPTGSGSQPGEISALFDPVPLSTITSSPSISPPLPNGDTTGFAISVNDHFATAFGGAVGLSYVTTQASAIGSLVQSTNPNVHRATSGIGIAGNIVSILSATFCGIGEFLKHPGKLFGKSFATKLSEKPTDEKIAYLRNRLGLDKEKLKA